MRDHLTSVRSLKFISVAEAIFIIYLIGLFIYLLAHANQSSSVTITPPITFSSPTVTSPNTAQQPSGVSSSNQATIGNI